jgi:CubicO group peptidase (beta-lactamase class C family)
VVVPVDPLPTTTPSAAQVDARGVLALLDALESLPDLEMHSLMVLRHGQVLAQGWWSPFTAERPHLLYSLSKSFTSTALGLAVAEGRVGLDDLVVDHFPEFAAEVTDPGSRAIRVRHAASMATGHTDDMWDLAVERDAAEPVRGFLLLPPPHAPGTVFAYNQPATYSVAAIVQRATGETLVDYLRPRLLDPLGVGPVGWQQQPPGRDLGFSGLHASTDAIARLGQLLLQRGEWQGQRLLPAEWVDEATRSHVANPDEPNVDWQQGYGFQFWMSRHGYRGDGAFGQFCLVLPEQDMVVAITAATLDMQAQLDAVWTHLLPALDRASSPTADAELAARTAALAVSPYVAAGAPPATADAWDGAMFEPAGGGCAEQPSLTGIEVCRDGDGWAAILVEGTDRLRRTIGASGWSLPAATDDEPDPVPTATSGGWQPDGTLAVHLLFLETPHRLVLTCDLPSRTFTAQWQPLPPLRGGPLDGVRSPRA